ncbi:SH3 domain-containing protein Dlish [Drosophila teissieri]|uniref:SH3 domain-containing protein Dlish n=1 Tax=Drosophila teissieri TaxID=7243 RepID=UPI001CBA4E0B|nr:SH3 domain-containing protein Dlish [Drosophila teissieri]
MAFLCPVRMRRDKKKATNASIERDLPAVGVLGMGRITGSSSIETLVRVGIEKEHGLSPDSKMVVLHDFTPCVDDELEVKRGQLVNILYRENDWVYVIGQDSRQEGFIPFSYCAPCNTQLADLAVKKKLPREQCPEQPIEENIPLLGTDNKLDVLCDETLNPGSANSIEKTLLVEPECTPFVKEPSGRCIVLYTFIARDENDLSVERGEFVTVLNREDPDWFWIMRSDGQEGFVPASFIYPADSVRVLQQQKATLNAMETILQQGQPGPQTQQQQQPQLGLGTDDLRYHGTELVMLYDYKAQAPDDLYLSVRRGDWIYADLTNQTVDGWLWAYAPKTRKYGFIPKAYARPPAMTSL